MTAPITQLAAQLDEALTVLGKVATALPVLRTMLAAAGLQRGADIAAEHLAAADAVLAQPGPIPSQVATWERERRVGELVERLPRHVPLLRQKAVDGPDPDVWWCRSLRGPTAIACLEAALGPTVPVTESDEDRRFREATFESGYCS